MTIRRWLALTSFALIAAATITGLVLTRARPVPPAVDSAPAAGKADPKKAASPRKERLVDESPLQTARRLMPLAVTPAERQLALQAERIANHSVDLAFADALRRAQEEPPAPTPQTQELIQNRDNAEAALEEDRKAIAVLNGKLATATPKTRSSLEDQLEVAKAQQELDQDELDQAREALERVGGDPQGRIQRLKAAHNAVEPAASAPAFQEPLHQTASLLARIQQLQKANAKLQLLRQARKESQDKGLKMIERRVVFAQRVATEGTERLNAKDQAAGFTHGDNVQSEATRDLAKETVKTLKHFTAGQRRLANFGRRIQDQEELTEVYNNWIALAQLQQQVALHATLKWVLAILAVVLAVYLTGHLFQRFFAKLMQGQDRVGRMPKMVKFAAEALGAVTILFLVVGLPSQMTTVFGLAGAGLTVALKDFIVAFFGWFILVGRNGIHVGDWVEIKGVGGEVVEIGLLRTLLMETGSWNDASHPTGRIVSFVNNFAMEGHFFNFSTKGQWLWDELRVLVPSDQDPYPFIDAIRTLVDRATEANAALAQEEWLRSGRKGRAQSVSALPGVNVVSTAQGFEIRVRYITRAYERNTTQRTLNQAVLELMLGKRKALTAPAGSPE